MCTCALMFGLAAAGMLHPRVPADSLHQMVAFLEAMHLGANVQRTFGGAGGPWEFNLRDLLRWCFLAESAVPEHMHNTAEGEAQVGHHPCTPSSSKPYQIDNT